MVQTVCTAQELCKQAKRIAGLFNSQAVFTQVSSLPADEVLRHDGGHTCMPGDVSGRRMKTPKRKGASLIGQGATPAARQALPAGVGNPTPLAPDTAGNRDISGLDTYEDHTASLVSIFSVSNGKSKT